MADNEAKAIQLVADAEKKLGSSKGGNNQQTYGRDGGGDSLVEKYFDSLG